jgi:subfamily B ATP-binding cassette protein HlyB/CyaB
MEPNVSSIDAGRSSTQSSDSGLVAFVLLARILGVVADPDQLRHQFLQGAQAFRADEMLFAAKRLGLKARRVSSNWGRLAATALPAIASLKDGRFLLIGRHSPDQVLVHDPVANRPLSMTRDEFVAAWSGDLILCTKRGVIFSGNKAFDLSWFLPAIHKYRRLFSEVLIASFILQLLALVTPLFFQVVIDKVLVHQGLTTLNVLAIGLLAVSFFEVVLGGLRTYLFSHTTNRVDVELGAKLYGHLQRLPMSFFASRPVGTVVARLRELETVRSFITGTALTLCVDAVFTVVFFAVMYYYSSTLFWIVFATVPAYGVLSYVVTPILRRRLDENFQRSAENQAFLVESVSSAETVKAMAIEPQMQRRWEEQLAGYVQASFKSQNLGNIANQIAGFISKVSVVLILWVGAYSVIDGALTIGQLVAFNMLAGRVSGPILRIVQLWQEFQQTRVSIEKIGEIMNAPTEAGTAGARTALPTMHGQVRFESVSFRYSPDRPEVLKGIDIEIKSGEVIGIVGRSGSGKSTLSKLVQRMYTPESGRVLMDGVDLAMVDASWLRRNIGVVLQENVLFRRTVRENIALADPGMPMEQVVNAAKLAGAHDFILELPQAYDTLIEEHGSNLSGGQRQRIAIARALVSNPRVLIFDEATSALDYESERIVQDNMRQICRNRTVFIIAHRLTAVKHADRIVVLDRGEIIEQGSHRELIERKGAYAALYQHQAA